MIVKNSGRNYPLLWSYGEKLRKIKIMKFLIKKCKDGSFDGDDGKHVEYYWLTTLGEDGITREIGSKESEKEGASVEFDLQASEGFDRAGKKVLRYKRV